MSYLKKKLEQCNNMCEFLKKILRKDRNKSLINNANIY